MDVGSVAYTEFDMSPDVISYMAEHPELLDCKMGLIHSHNNMSTFFSGTDINTLKEEGIDRNHFVSLIVNNAGQYTAAITRKIKYTAVRNFQYDSFDGVVNLDNSETLEGEELEYFNLDIVFEEESDSKFVDISNRLKEIKSKKTVINKPTTYGGGISYPEWKKTHPDTPLTTTNVYKQPSLFNDYYDDDPIPTFERFKEEPKKVKKESHKVPTATTKEVNEIVNQLITGSVTVTKLDSKDDRDILIKSIDARFDARFGKDDPSLTLFEYWATDFIEFLLWFGRDNGVSDDESVAVLVENLTVALETLPKSKYINKYIDIISSYGKRAF